MKDYNARTKLIVLIINSSDCKLIAATDSVPILKCCSLEEVSLSLFAEPMLLKDEKKRTWPEEILLKKRS